MKELECPYNYYSHSHTEDKTNKMVQSFVKIRYMILV